MSFEDALQHRLRESEERVAPYAAVFDRVAPTARSDFEQMYRSFLAERRAQREVRTEYSRLGMDPVRRSFAEDEQYRRGFGLFRSGPTSSVTPLDRPPIRDTVALARGLTVQPHGLGGSTIRDFAIEDRALDFFGPPYASEWTDTQGDQSHQQQEAWAHKSNGHFGFIHTIGQEGGWAHSAAAIWVHFVPSAAPGQAEVRAYTPYSYAWQDVSYLDTAHNDASFGVFVHSWDTNGQDLTVEQDYRYSLWSDGTSWYEHHNSPSAPGWDDDHAFLWGNEAPYFPVRTNRLYSAAIWCFGSCDANGASLTDASYAQAGIQAQVGFVVIGQQ